jgi:hypothetical protein
MQVALESSEQYITRLTTRRHGKSKEDTLKARRLLLVSIITSLPLLAAAGPAAADPPIGDCPPAFDGPSTFTQILLDFPPPPGTPIEDILATFDFYDKNNDESLCVLDVPGPGINLVDNDATIP